MKQTIGTMLHVLNQAIISALKNKPKKPAAGSRKF
jgi:hypothetical protein